MSIQSELKSEIENLFASEELNPVQIEDVLQSHYIPLEIKLTCLPIVLADDVFIEEYSNETSHLFNEIKKLIKENSDKYQYKTNDEDTQNDELKDKVSYVHLQNLLTYDNCPVDLLETFSTHTVHFLREKIGSNENCPENILEKLSNDEHWAVRYAVAKNENCPENILEKLSQDKNINVRFSVLDNHSIPTKMLDQIYNNDYYKDYRNNNSYLIYHTVSNPNCSSDLLEKIFSNHLNNFDYLSLQEEMRQKKQLSFINDKTEEFSYACEKIINHPNSTPELKDKVIQKLLNTTKEEFNLNSIIPQNQMYYSDPEAGVDYFDKIDYYKNFINLNLNILNDTKKNARELNLLPETIKKIKIHRLNLLNDNLNNKVSELMEKVEDYYDKKKELDNKHTQKVDNKHIPIPQVLNRSSLH